MKPALPATLLKLAAVAVLFYASYGLTNYLTALRAPVPEIIYGWERAMPFVPWTIIPYWSLNLLYALGFFLARTRASLHYSCVFFLHCLHLWALCLSHREGG